MTPRERAQWIIDHYRHIGPEDSREIMGDIEKSIVIAVAEEREACAMINDEKAAEIDPGRDVDYGRSNPEGYSADQQTARALRDAARQIRARSEG